MQNGRPISWALSTTDPADLNLQTKLLLLDLPENIPQTCIPAENYYALAARTAHSIMQSGRAPLIDFRRGELAAPDKLRLHRRPLNALLAAAAVLLIALAGVFLWRAHEYRDRARSSEQQLADA